MIKQLFTTTLGLIIAFCSFAQNYSPELIDDMMDENQSADAAIHYLKGDLLYVTALNSDNDYELKVLNLKDSTISSTGVTSKKGNFYQEFIHFFEFKGKTHFASTTRSTPRTTTVWSTDGTVANTKELFTENFSFWEIIATSNYLILPVGKPNYGQELFVSDGTQSAPTLLKDIHPGYNHSYVKYLTLHNNLVYFSADNGTQGAELWKTDGTKAGTVMVKDFNVGKNGTIPGELISFNSELLLKLLEFMRFK